MKTLRAAGLRLILRNVCVTCYMGKFLKRGPIKTEACDYNRGTCMPFVN